MSVVLEIRDGSPYWWNSPDLWVVPGNDPNGAAGQPIAGRPAYLWGRVHNKGSESAIGARINFYWSNPATGVLRSNSTFIGSSFVDLNPGEIQEVLCLTPWMPTIVNDGHECVVAEVIHPLDPLPIPLPDVFDPPSYHQIAQKNLSVLVMGTAMLILPIQLAAPAREKRLLEVFVDIGKEMDREVLHQLGLDKIKYAKNPTVKAELSLRRECGKINDKNPRTSLKVELDAGMSMAVYLKVAPDNPQTDVYTPINVTAHDGKKLVGGVTFIAIHSGEK